MTIQDWMNLGTAALTGPVSIVVFKYVTERKAARESAKFQAEKDTREGGTVIKSVELGLLPQMMDRYEKRIESLEKQRHEMEVENRKEVERLERYITRVRSFLTKSNLTDIPSFDDP